VNWHDRGAAMSTGSMLAPVPDELTQNVRNGLLHLTRAECRIAVELLTGTANESIAEMRGLSKRTVEEHVANIMRKCGCSRLQFMRVCCVELAGDHLVIDHVVRSASAPPNLSMVLTIDVP
jgi:DNA-binding NarL/FixJ family response regulator